MTVCMATHPARQRNGLFNRAFQSVLAQTRQPEAILIHNDVEKRGVGVARQRLLDQVQTQWLIWLDSDDEWLPDHLDALYSTAIATDSVYVFSWMHGTDPLGHFGLSFDPCRPHHTTMAILERTDIAREAGFIDTMSDEFRDQHWFELVSNEDWFHTVRFSQICCERGLKMTHLPERTWIYHSQGGLNSSGRPFKGDAAM